MFLYHESYKMSVFKTEEIRVCQYPCCPLHLYRSIFQSKWHETGSKVIHTVHLQLYQSISWSPWVSILQEQDWVLSDRSTQLYNQCADYSVT